MDSDFDTAGRVGHKTCHVTLRQAPIGRHMVRDVVFMLFLDISCRPNPMKKSKFLVSWRMCGVLYQRSLLLIDANVSFAYLSRLSRWHTNKQLPVKVLVSYVSNLLLLVWVWFKLMVVDELKNINLRFLEVWWQFVLKYTRFWWFFHCPVHQYHYVHGSSDRRRWRFFTCEGPIQTFNHRL